MRQLFAILIITAFFSCSKGKKDAPVVPAPGRAVLVAPAINSACTQGTVVSATESTVALSWNAAPNAESYEVFIKNLLTGVTLPKTSTTTSLSVNLNQNTPYSWYVVSKTSQTTATASSEIWKFYNAGTTSSYAPFPAELTLPANHQTISLGTGKTTLDWSGNDADNDISGYDVYLGTTLTNMVVIKTNVTESIANEVTIAAGRYYWKVLTKDGKGNSSTSEVHQFTVN